MDLHSAQTFWLIRNGLLNTYSTLDKPMDTEVLVIGCGVTGALIAHSLTSAGFATIAIDKREVAWGSSAASTALLQYEIDTGMVELAELADEETAAQIYRASVHGLDKVSNLCEELGVLDFSRRKSFYFASKRSDEDELLAEFRLREKYDFPVELWDRSKIAAQFDMPAELGIMSYKAAEVDVYQLTHALLQNAVAQGLQVFDRTPLKALKHDETGVTAVLENGHSIRARHVVLACGYETTQYCPDRVARLHSSFAFVSEPLKVFPGWHEKTLIWETARPYFYACTTADGRALMGGEDIPFRNPAARDSVLPKKVERLLKRSQEIFPNLKLAPSFAWAGTFAETKDGLPYIGAHPKVPHSSFAMCYGGNGIVYSMLAAEIITAELQGHKHPDAELFSFQRPWA